MMTTEAYECQNIESTSHKESPETTQHLKISARKAKEKEHPWTE